MVIVCGRWEEEAHWDVIKSYIDVRTLVTRLTHAVTHLGRLNRWPRSQSMCGWTLLSPVSWLVQKLPCTRLAARRDAAIVIAALGYVDPLVALICSLPNQVVSRECGLRKHKAGSARCQEQDDRLQVWPRHLHGIEKQANHLSAVCSAIGCVGWAMWWKRLFPCSKSWYGKWNTAVNSLRSYIVQSRYVLIAKQALWL